jgi:CxxC motif-containing protein (DUF1111 family)
MACLVLSAIWYFLPGVPVFWGPSASAATRDAGQALFVHDWTPNDTLARGDGLGPVFNARSCVACHFQGGIGGAGTNEHNVNTFLALPTIRDREMRSGLVHASAVDPAHEESFDIVRKLFPIVPGGVRVVGGCSVRFEDFDPIKTESVNTTALFGAGWIDRLSDKSVTHNWRRRLLEGTAKEFNLDFTSLPAGRPRALPGGRVGKFGWKGQFATLEEFVAAACANELGLGNPLLEQPKPLSQPDYPAVKPDITRKQFRQLVAFVDTLPRPQHVAPSDPAQQAAVHSGQQLFASIGCAHCHTPDLGGLRGVYSDFLLHRVFDPELSPGYFIEQTPEVPLPSDQPTPDEWKTPPLWGVADSAPYFHDGGSPTLRDAIVRHRGSAARVTEIFQNLQPSEQEAVIAFLMTLKAPADALPGVDKNSLAPQIVQR